MNTALRFDKGLPNLERPSRHLGPPAPALRRPRPNAAGAPGAQGLGRRTRSLRRPLRARRRRPREAERGEQIVGAKERPRPEPHFFAHGQRELGLPRGLRRHPHRPAQVARGRRRAARPALERALDDHGADRQRCERAVTLEKHPAPGPPGVGQEADERAARGLDALVKPPVAGRVGLVERAPGDQHRRAPRLERALVGCGVDAERAPRPDRHPGARERRGELARVALGPRPRPPRADHGHAGRARRLDAAQVDRRRRRSQLGEKPRILALPPLDRSAHGGLIGPPAAAVARASAPACRATPRAGRPRGANERSATPRRGAETRGARAGLRRASARSLRANFA